MTPSASASPPSERTALVVAGMHRSGTSAMSRVLSLAGAGMPDRVITAAEDNPLGFWEPADVVALNNEVLRAVGSDWNDVFGIHATQRAEPMWPDFVPRARSVVASNFAAMPLAVMKDPRVSLLAPLWREALTQEGFRPVFVIMVRDPIEVAQSIAARDGASVQASTLSWLSHMVAIERDTRDASRVFVRYSDLVDDWRPVMDRIAHVLGVTMPVSEEAAEQISGFLSRSARHHTSDDADWTGRSDLWPGVAQAWKWLIAAAGETAAHAPFPDTIAEELELLASRMEPTIASMRDGFLHREHDFQTLLGDRERLLLRLKALAEEQRTFVADQADQLAEARQEASVLTEVVEATLEETTRMGAGDASAKDAGLADRLRHQIAVLKRHVSALEDQSRAGQRRQIELEHSQQALEKITEELTLTHNHADNLAMALADRTAVLEQTVEVAETRQRELDQAEERIRLLQTRLDAVTTSTSWALLRPVRVVQKRLRKS